MSTRVISHWINNTPQNDADSSTLPVWNPATGEMQAEVVLATDSVVDDAVRSAAEAFALWSEESLAARTKVMFAFREIINSRAGQLAEIISDEHGKVLSDAAGEVQRGLEVVEFACSLPTLTNDLIKQDSRCHTHVEALHLAEHGNAHQLVTKTAR